MNGDSYSLYFHVPFCTKKCSYCHFYVIPDKDYFKQEYMQGLKREWSFQTSKIPTNKKLVSVYFGGGTPALLGSDNIAKILDWISPTHDVEITLEANPENINSQLMKEYFQVGINRVSIGIQSLDENLLKILGRTHDAQKAIAAVHTTANVGISNISIDLMYDLPYQTLKSWENTVQTALNLPISHLSLYNLTIEPQTAFFKKRSQLAKHLPSEELSFQMLEYAIHALTQFQMKRYEISAFCKNAQVSKHNLGYWVGRPFLGFGPSAFSFWEGKRFRNIANLSKYNKMLVNGESPIDFEEFLSKEESQNELLAIGLRIIDGVNLIQFSKEFGPLTEKTHRVIQKLVDDGLLLNIDSTVKLSEKGLAFYDLVAEEII